MVARQRIVPITRGTFGNGAVPLHRGVPTGRSRTKFDGVALKCARLRPVQEAQHPPADALACTGGQGTLPYEQYTQQSPDFGLSTLWQPTHS